MNRRTFAFQALPAWLVGISLARPSLAQLFTERQAQDLRMMADAMALGDYPLKGIAWDMPYDPLFTWYDRARVRKVADLVLRGLWDQLDLPPNVRHDYLDRAERFGAPDEFNWLMEPREELDVGDRLETMILRRHLQVAGIVGPDPRIAEHGTQMAAEIHEYVRTRGSRRAIDRTSRSRTYAMFDSGGRGQNRDIESSADRQDILVRALDWIAMLQTYAPEDVVELVEDLYVLVWGELERTLTRNRSDRTAVGYRVGDGQEDPELTAIALAHELPVSPYVVAEGRINGGFGHPNVGPNVAASRYRRAVGITSTQFAPFTRDNYDGDSHTIGTDVDSLVVSTAQGAPLV